MIIWQNRNKYLWESNGMKTTRRADRHKQPVLVMIFVTSAIILITGCVSPCPENVPAFSDALARARTQRGEFHVDRMGEMLTQAMELADSKDADPKRLTMQVKTREMEANRQKWLAARKRVV